MKNELGRKLTSLTIMAIMVAGGLTIAAPSFMPETAAQSEKLMFVSAESEEFGNTIGGGMIVEIIVADPTRSAVNEEQGEPTVEVNGDTIRMVQAEDGYWYAYIADTTKLAAMDQASGTDHLDYGLAQTAGANLNPECVGCTTHGTNDAGVAIDADVTVYIGASIIKGEPTLSRFNTTDPSLPLSNAENADSGLFVGQINITTNGVGAPYTAANTITHPTWPFIQTVDMTEGEQAARLQSDLLFE